MKTAVLVCGIGCSGTSLTAGIVHTCGVPLYLENHSNNHPVTKYPLHEDACFYSFGGNIEKFKSIWREHATIYLKQGYKKFGVKNTVISLHLNQIVTWLLENNYHVKIVAVHRMVNDSVLGRMNGKCPPGKYYTKEEAWKWANLALSEYHKGLYSLNYWPAKILHIQYEWLLEDINRQNNIDQIYQFLWDKPIPENVLEDCLSLFGNKE